MEAIQRALLSVYDKTGIIDFARILHERKIEIVSTGGTYAAIRDAGIPVISITELTGFPEMLDGRVKTLHPNVHGGILARRDLVDHIQQLLEQSIVPIDLVAINLYPFEQTVATGSGFDECIEQIDIGGPAMLRSAAKNHQSVTVICDVADYRQVALEILEHGDTKPETRSSLAAKVFKTTAAYDAAISTYLDSSAPAAPVSAEPLLLPPERLVIDLPKIMDLRYGENPHQSAALYGTFFDAFEPLHGKELSYNNIVDIEAAVALIDEFVEPAAAIIKHTNPCGCAVGPDILTAYSEALTTDPLSAFGGIIALNREVNEPLAEKINELFSEAVIAPSFSEEALEILRSKRNRRLLRRQNTDAIPFSLQVKSLQYGYLCQTSDTAEDDEALWNTVTKRAPTDEERAALSFAWKVARHVKSNSIVYTNAVKTLGVGAGQMSRVDSSSIAAMKATNAGLSLKSCVVASDAFFPFADGLLEAVRAGATAVIQPGGSIRDDEVIAAADEHDIAMVFTGIRHFKH